jgi:hypothetical protein
MDGNHGSCSVDSEIEEERAGGGPGQPAEGRSRRTGGGSGPTTSIRNDGGAFTNRMTAETLGVRADIVCTYAYGPLRPVTIRSDFKDAVDSKGD